MSAAKVQKEFQKYFIEIPNVWSFKRFENKNAAEGWSPGATALSSNGRWVLLVKEVDIVEIHLQSSDVPPCLSLHLHPSCHPQHHYQEAPHVHRSTGNGGANGEPHGTALITDITRPRGSWQLLKVVYNSSTWSCHKAIVHSWIMSLLRKLHFLHLLLLHR